MADIDFSGGRGTNMNDPRFPMDSVNLRTLKRFASILSANTVSAVVSGITAGANILITGTTSAITISVNPNISTSSINANTLFSAGTNLYDIFLTTNDGNDITRVQNGLNTYTAGTGNFPTVNVSALTIDHLTVSGSSVFNSISATTYHGLPVDVYVTGGTYSLGTATFRNNTGGTFNVSGFSDSNATQFTGGTVSGETIFLQGVTANTFSATTYYGDGSNLTGIVATWDGLQVITVGENVVAGNLLFLSSDTKYYKASNLSASTCDTELRIAVSAITANNTGSGLVQGRFTTTGLTVGAQYWVGASGNFTDIQPSLDFSIVRYVGTSLSSISLEFNPDATYIELGTPIFDDDNYLPLSGGTVTGPTIFSNGLTSNYFSATTISATTFYGDGSQLTGIISGAIFTGGTVSGETIFLQGVTANTFSATTFYGDGSQLTGIITNSSIARTFMFMGG